VPRVGDGAAAALLVPPLPVELPRSVRAARWLRAKARQWWPPVLLAAMEEPKQEESTTPGDQNPQGPPGEVEKPPSGGSRVPTPEQPAPEKEPVSFSAGARDESALMYHWGSAAVAALALLILIGVLLGRRGRVQTDDSDDFRAALEVMRPWIVLGYPTPRLLKRYLNHKRFVAMRQREDEEPESLLGQWASRLGRVLGLAEAPPSKSAPRAGLAEPLLVALSALHQSRPDWQTSPDWLIDDYFTFKTWFGGVGELVGGPSVPMPLNEEERDYQFA